MDIITYALSKKNTGGSSGATEEQATQIQTNTNNISELKEDISSLSEEIEALKLKESGTVNGVGWGASAISNLISILRTGIYTSDQSDNITALEKQLSSESTSTEITATYVNGTLSISGFKSLPSVTFA